MVASSHLSKIYRAGWGNLTDLYQLTMAYGYWKNGIHERPANFHLFFRNHPFKGHFTVAAGLALAVDYLQSLAFSVSEVQYLGGLKGADGKALFEESFLHYLQRLRFTGNVQAVPEGTVMFPHEPLLRIEAPLLQAQLVETALL
ncbi:MAG: nicotinate phosphoribosyltransferase, partial [Bacteroidota bacterium]